MKSYFKPIKAYIWKSFHGCSSDEGAAVKWLKDEARDLSVLRQTPETIKHNFAKCMVQ